MRTHRVRVYPLPSWLDVQRLLGPSTFEVEAMADGWLCAHAELLRDDAADLAARLRGIGIAGKALSCEITPRLDRSVVRAARLQDARRRREGSPGFTQRGVQLDEQGRYSLTPESLALEIGKRAAGLHVIDAGCGAGGNAIGFARGGARVTAIERDAQRLSMARHNAELYGVAAQIEFRLGDALALVPQLTADLLFVDPPWGQDWDRKHTALSDLPLLAAMLELRERPARLWAKLPASFDPSSVLNANAHAVFGTGVGDARRIKFVLLESSTR